VVALIRLPHSLGTEGLSWKPIGLGSWHSQTPHPIHLIIHPRPPQPHLSGLVAGEIEAPSHLSTAANATSPIFKHHRGPNSPVQASQPQRLFGRTAVTRVQMPGERTPIVSIQQAFGFSGGGSQSSLGGRTASNPIQDPGDLLEAVKHARAYLRGKATRQTEQEGE